MIWKSLKTWKKGAVIFPLFVFTVLLLVLLSSLFEAWPEISREEVYYCPAKGLEWIECDLWRVLEHWIVGPFFIVLMLPALFFLAPFEVMTFPQEYAQIFSVLACGLGVFVFCCIGAILGHLIDKCFAYRR